MTLPEFLRRYGTRTPGLIVRRLLMLSDDRLSVNTAQVAQELQRDLTAMLETEMAALAGLDACSFCLGRKGGVPGNENVYPVYRAEEEMVDGLTACDYCSALVDRVLLYRGVS